MQRDSLPSSFAAEDEFDSAALLASAGFFDDDGGDDVYRSVESSEYGLGSLCLDDPDRRALEEPVVYRSVTAVEEPYKASYKGFNEPYENPTLVLAAPDPGKYGKGFRVQVKPSSPQDKVSIKPPLFEKLVPKWKGYVTMNAEPLPGRDFKQTWMILLNLMKQLDGVSDFKANPESGELTGTYWGTGEPTTFTLNVYQDKNTREFTIDFQRRSGSCFDFHRVKDEVLFALLEKPKSPRVDFKNMKDPETGRNMSEMIVEEQDLNDWSSAMRNSHLELRRELTAILARASEHSAELMRKHSGIVEELYTSAFSSDTICTRYAMVALTNLLKDAPLCTKQQLDKIFEVAQDSNLKEVQMRCWDAIHAVMQCPQSSGLKERCGRYLEQIKSN